MKNEQVAKQIWNVRFTQTYPLGYDVFGTFSGRNWLKMTEIVSKMTG